MVKLEQVYFYPPGDHGEIMQTIDIQRVRKDTPGCEQVVHLNNAGASLMPRQVLDEVVGFLNLEALTGGYEAAEQREAQIARVYESIAALLGCGADEIAVVENATRAWDMAFYAVPFQPGDRILTAMAEYGSNYIAFLQVARQKGVRIDVIPNDEAGQVSVEALKGMLDERVRLIAITHVPTNGGLVNPAAEIGKIARDANILYLLDACQSVGQMPIDVQTTGCDILSGTGRKYLRGPRGTGFLYVRRDWIERLEPPLLDLHAAVWTARDEYVVRKDARRFENWETNYAGKVGLGAAVDYALSLGLDPIWERVSSLGAYMRSCLGAIPGGTLHDLGRVKCGIVSFTVAGIDAETVRKRLLEHKINVSTSPVESTRLDMDERGLTRLVRASVHYFNTGQEIDHFCRVVEQILAG